MVKQKIVISEFLPMLSTNGPLLWVNYVLPCGFATFLSKIMKSLMVFSKTTKSGFPEYVPRSVLCKAQAIIKNSNKWSYLLGQATGNYCMTNYGLFKKRKHRDMHVNPHVVHIIKHIFEKRNQGNSLC